ncbi:MAG: hypothetical protein A3B70_03915 [Deltaproteobacteria bacterium RIFCSPHIGHO2_02_FULL_40_11]|nr:MAG: hypothetical protein A3B70_03915 [Deltaproteobacteria bacterium RIFCSPHIGHO2_02_FULL_40_11]
MEDIYVSSYHISIDKKKTLRYNQNIMASKTQVTEMRRKRKRTKLGKQRKRRIRSKGTTPKLLPTK